MHKSFACEIFVWSTKTGAYHIDIVNNKNMYWQKKMNTTSIQVRDSFIVNALRNCGYNNYAAIADIIDNSVEPEVDATSVKIQFSTDSGKGGPIKSINIIDNGCGMDFDTMNEAMCLGSMTGKTGETNLGMYGAGLKTAALSLGKKLTVISRTQGSDYLSKAVLDITEACKNGGPIELSIDKIPKKQKRNFFRINFRLICKETKKY